MKRFLLALAMLCSPLEGSAKTILVGPAGVTTTPADSGSSTTVALSVANSIAKPGDLIIVGNGTYATRPNPTNNGTQAAFIMYVGEGFPSASTTQVTASEEMPQLRDFNSSKQYVTWKYLSFQGPIEWAPSAVASHDSMAYCRLTPNPTSEDVWSIYAANDMVVTGCYIVQDEIYMDVIAGRSHRDTLTNNTISANARFATGGSITGHDCWSMKGATNWVMQNNTINLTRTANRFPMFMEYCKSNTFTGNTWNCSGPDGSTIDRTWIIRDSCRSNVFRRDKFYVTGGGGFYSGFEFSASGAVVSSCGSNRWDSCTVVNPYGMPMFFQNGMRGDTLTYNSVAGHYGSGIYGWQSAAIGNDILIRHNTFYADIPSCAVNDMGTGVLVIFQPSDGSVAPLDTMKVFYNIFASGNTSTSYNAFGLGLHAIADTAKIQCDYNLMYHSGQIALAGDLAVRYKATDGIPVLPSKVGSATTWCLASNNDCLSSHSSPLLDNLSSTIAGFDPDPTATSPALSNTAWPDSFVGSRRPTADGTSPDAITDVSVIQISTNGMTLRWTGVGDDGQLGIPLYYDIRYSTATITSGNFTSAASVGGPTPSVAGVPLTKAVVGLAANTTYYFAVKAVDENGNAGAISNVVTAVSLPSGGGGGPSRLPDE